MNKKIAIVFTTGLLLTATAGTSWAHSGSNSVELTDGCGAQGEQDGDFQDTACDKDQTGDQKGANGQSDVNEQNGANDQLDEGDANNVDEKDMHDGAQGNTGATGAQGKNDGQQGNNDGENED